MAESKKNSKSNKKKTSLYVAPEPAHRPRKIGCPEEMQTLWEEYKCDCDNHMVRRSQYDKDTRRVNNILVYAPRTYTIKGFCIFVGITESSFERTYRSDELYSDILELMDMETEIDARGKFEDGSLNAKLAALWMGRHKGYSVKNETKLKGGGIPVVISGEEALKD